MVYPQARQPSQLFAQAGFASSFGKKVPLVSGSPEQFSQLLSLTATLTIRAMVNAGEGRLADQSQSGYF